METRSCQNCKKDFTIEPDDFGFYEEMHVAPPTMCPVCRLMRRYAWRNERSLFRATCGLCGKNMLSAYAPGTSAPIYCHECWYSDGWDAASYAREYDFSRPFFEQWKELFDAVPRMNLSQVNSVNSEYANTILDAKNTYLAYSIVESEDVLYSKNIDRSRQIIDCLCVSDSERLAYTIYSAGSYDLVHSHQVRACLESAFLFDCINATECFMSANVRNGKYVFRNEQCTKEEYEKRLQEIDFGVYTTWQTLVAEFEEMKKNAIHKYADILKSADTTGDALTGMNNCHECFEAYGNEDTKWASRCFYMTDAYDVNNVTNSELMYEYITQGSACNNVAFSIALLNGSNDVRYSGWSGGEYLFGCVGLRSKKYCILNKEYSEEEYKALVPKIIEHMNAMPYTGANGRVYRYGEFFPIEFSPFAYNESIAQEQFPLREAEVKARGYIFRAPKEKTYTPTTQASELPDHIRDTTDTIAKEIIACEHAADACVHQCTKAFRVTGEELSMCRRFNIPLPRTCPNCRHYKRLEYRKPWELWYRQCMCELANHDHVSRCPNAFETPYAPERPEKVYCESCYQKEVM